MSIIVEKENQLIPKKLLWNLSVKITDIKVYYYITQECQTNTTFKGDAKSIARATRLFYSEVGEALNFLIKNRYIKVVEKFDTTLDYAIYKLY